MTDTNAQSTSTRKLSPTHLSRMGRFGVILLIGLLLLAGFFLNAIAPVKAASVIRPASIAATHILISEFRTTGPGGASDEFIEIYNPISLSTAIPTPTSIPPISLNGWTIKKTSSCGATVTTLVTFGASDSIAPGQHLLLVNAAASAALLAMADKTYALSVADDGGIAILDNLNNKVDSVGMCAGFPYVEGTALTKLTTTVDRGYERNSCDDTDDNNADFHIVSPSNPQSILSSSPIVICDDIYTATAQAAGTQTAVADTAIAQAFGTQTAVSDTATAQVFGTQTAAANTATALASITLSATVFTPTPTLSPTFTSPPASTFTPTSHPARTLLINEVAWGGTKANSSDEWIELYNPSSTKNISLSGWTLTIIRSSAAPIVIKLDVSKTILAGEYYLLEHDEDTTSIASDQLVPNISLSNNPGNILLLKDPSTKTIDTANQNQGKWPAGSGSPTYCSMERRLATAADDDNGWFTNNNGFHYAVDSGNNQICGSPKNKNWAYTVTATPTKAPTRTKTPTRTRTPTKTKTPTKTRTPTLAPQVVSQVVINEFLTLPRYDANQDGVIDSGDSFIEIENLSTIPVSVTGWVLDDQDGDSSPYTLPSLTLEPHARQVYFASETHIVLSNAGDSVRLFHGQLISDAFTYPVIRVVGQSWCRLPDGYGNWTFGCEPTPHLVNRLASSVFVNDQPQSKVCLSTTTLAVVYEAECASPGLAIWSPDFWLGDLQKDFPLYIHRQKQVDIIE